MPLPSGLKAKGIPHQIEKQKDQRGNLKTPDDFPAVVEHESISVHDTLMRKMWPQGKASNSNNSRLHKKTYIGTKNIIPVDI